MLIVDETINLSIEGTVEKRIVLQIDTLFQSFKGTVEQKNCITNRYTVSII